MRSPCLTGRTDSGEIVSTDVLPEGSPAANPAFTSRRRAS